MNRVVIFALTVRLSGLVGACAIPVASSALTIVPTFDASVTSLANATTIESAFNSVASLYDQALSNNAIVNVDVGWNEIDGAALPKNTVGASESYLEGFYTYAQIKAALTAAAASNAADKSLALAVSHLPSAAPAGPTNYAVTSAQAKALGFIPATQSSVDGFVGFAGSPTAYGFTPAAVTSILYDFQAVAAHELSEVLGRVSGLDGGSYRTPLDLYRYSAAGTLSYTYRTPTYYSIDGGATRLLAFNAASSGDRADWATTTTTDAFDAFISKGETENVSAIDLAVLDTIGWSGANAGNTGGSLAGTAFTLSSGTPEPMTWALMLAGFGTVGTALRRRRVAITA